MIFADKEYFLLLLLLIPLFVWIEKQHKSNRATLTVSSGEQYLLAEKSWRVKLSKLPRGLFYISALCLVVVLARPQLLNSWNKKTTEGIDIMMAMDVSTSMLAMDLNPNRIEAAKQVASEFILNRPNDNIGLTIFAGEAFTQCPMTTDHNTLINMLQTVRTDIAARGLIEDGTAIGMGIANAVSRLKNSKAKSKVIILITDGSNNRGDISPLTAAGIAKNFGVRIYTIGIGTNDVANYPMTVGGIVQNVKVPVEIDTTMLRNIANETNGIFFRATSNKQLKKIYDDIDKMEKTRLEVRQMSQPRDVFMPFAIVAFLALLAEIVLKITLLRKIP